ncbi:unnamed protein product, partial [Dracunculus medinensis]|uniref:Phosphoinositide phospholipase C n=1 Tax=Dracunculus medinensis TaxID=318479 RepID=A0A158Q6H7_DRAME
GSQISVSIDNIKEIRIGRTTDLFHSSENSAAEIQEECAFSIIHGDNYESLDLIAHSPEDSNIWVTGLMNLINKSIWIGSVFDEEDSDKKGFISENLAIRLIMQMNNRLLIGRIKHKIMILSYHIIGSFDREIDKTFSNLTNKLQFFLFKDVATRPEVYFLMVRYANKDYLTWRDLQVFLETEQGMMGVTEDLCETIIEQHEPSDEAKANNFMTVDGFTNYLLDEECQLFDRNHRIICHEMNHPFSSYFIATSYKTYLVEDQIKGPASAEGITTALKRNCRFIELDLWDPIQSDNENEPMICRLKAAHSKLTASAAFHIINEVAFERSRFMKYIFGYPLFIRLVIHLSVQWQLNLVQLLQTIFGNKLYQPTLDRIDWINNKRLPSPRDFLTKIIIVGKKIESTDESEVSEDETKITLSECHDSGRIAICRKLSDLFCPWAIFTNVSDLSQASDKIGNKFHFSENILQYLYIHIYIYIYVYQRIKNNQMINICRVDSSNMNPQEFWNRGVQLVALNYQTPGLMMDLQEGKFSDNGGCGYILKPSIMRDHFFTFGDKLPFPPQILHLRILSGQQLPRPRGSTAKGDSADPYVIVEIFGIPMDCAEVRTKTIKNDSVNPSFDETFQFEITVPELALVRFLVLDDDYIDDDFIGQYTVPFECLQNGYRHIPLMNNEGNALDKSTLFIHTAVTNRRGGGKPKKRGMSVKRKSQRINTGMKLIGVKSIDDLFKIAALPLADSIQMRSKLEATMINWQEDCGIGPTGTVRQGLRVMHTRMLHPIIETRGVIPERLQRTIDSLKRLIEICEQILISMDMLLIKLEDTTKKISSSYNKLPEICAETGLRGLKVIRASENFAWNVRLLKAQLTLMSKTQTEANDIFTQVRDSISFNGMRIGKMKNIYKVLAHPWTKIYFK